MGAGTESRGIPAGGDFCEAKIQPPALDEVTRITLVQRKKNLPFFFPASPARGGKSHTKSGKISR